MTVSSLLLAAGRGERLRPLTDAVPKAALPLLDVPVGLWGLEALRRVAPPVLVNASWLAVAVRAALGGPDVEIVIEEPEPYGTGGTLRSLVPRFRDRVVVHNGDLITDLDPADLLETHGRLGCLGTIAVRDVNHRADLTHDGSRATNFVDRRFEQHPGAIYLGMAVFEKEALIRLDDRRPLGLGETLLKELAGSGDLAVHVHHGYAADVGTPETYIETSVDLLEGRAPSPPVEPPGRIVEARGGSAYLGPGAVAADDTLGRGAIVLAGASVASWAWVENAIVWPGVKVKSGREVRDTIAIADREL